MSKMQTGKGHITNTVAANLKLKIRWNTANIFYSVETPAYKLIYQLPGIGTTTPRGRSGIAIADSTHR